MTISEHVYGWFAILTLAFVFGVAFVLSGCTVATSNETLLEPTTVIEYLDDWKVLDKEIQGLAQLIYGRYESGSEELDVWLLSYYYSQAYLTALEMGDTEWADLNYKASEMRIAELKEMLLVDIVPSDGVTLSEGTSL